MIKCVVLGFFIFRKRIRKHWRSPKSRSVPSVPPVSEHQTEPGVLCSGNLQLRWSSSFSMSSFSDLMICFMFCSLFTVLKGSAKEFCFLKLSTSSRFHGVHSPSIRWSPWNKYSLVLNLRAHKPFTFSNQFKVPSELVTEVECSLELIVER